MQKIVYILGAGFSQPLGLPVMSNFIDMAKDLYFIDTAKYSHFSHVFKLIHEKLAWIKTVYNTDLNNIEEVLSILEMRRSLDHASEKELEEYTRFIVDVINYYTPPIIKPSRQELIAKGHYKSGIEAPDQLTLETLFFSNAIQRAYCGFVLGLFNSVTEFVVEEFKLIKPFITGLENPYAEYSVISLNYDLVLENMASYVSSLTSGKQISFVRSKDYIDDKHPVLVKLHGSVEDKIIPPTWNKTIHPTVERDWRVAYQLLNSANHIRIIGYSLPATDAYVRYLLKASVINNDVLKSITVHCLDDDKNTVQDKYRDFLNLPSGKYKFINEDVMKYLNSVSSRVIHSRLKMDDAPHPFG